MDDKDMNMPPHPPSVSVTSLSPQKEFNVAIKMKNWNHRELRERRKAFIINMDDEERKRERKNTISLSTSKAYSVPIKTQ
jgi:hypothetical protein